MWVPEFFVITSKAVGNWRSVSVGFWKMPTGGGDGGGDDRVFVRLQSRREREREGENAKPADYLHSDLIQLSQGTRALYETHSHSGLLLSGFETYS